MSAPRYHEVAFLPWAGLRDEVQIGPVTVWPFNKLADSKINDEELRNYLKKYFSCYVNSTGKPVDSVCVCSLDDSFKVVSPNEYQLFKKAIDALCFTTIAPAIMRAVESDNYSWAPPDVDCFLLFFQKFDLNSDTIAVSSGTITSFGPSISEMKFQKPSWVHSGMGINSRDKDLLQHLGASLSLPKLPRKKSQVFNAFEWFRLAHTAGDHVSFEPRVVMMATAYESLIDLPFSQKAVPLMTAVATKLFGFKHRMKGFKLKNQPVQKFPLGAHFANEFYRLRNAIVHGDKISSVRYRFSNPAIRASGQRSWLSKLIVADILLYELIWRVFVQKADKFNVNYQFDSIHQALGWSPNR